MQSDIPAKRMEVEQDSDYDPDQNSDNSFEIKLESPVAQKHQQAEFTSADSKKEVVEEVAKSITPQSTYNMHVPTAHLRTMRPVQITEESPVQFRNYLNKGQSAIGEVIQQIKSTLPKEELEGLDARCSIQVVAARVITSGKQSSNDCIVEIEDQKHQDKLDIGDELMWTGMISAMRIEWRSEYYMLKQKVHLPFEDQKPKHIDINNNPRSVKVVLAKGPFSPHSTMDFSCLQILTECLKNNQPDVLVLLGPFITKHNISGYHNFGDKTLRDLLVQIQQQLPHTQLVVVPSTHDVCNRYPIPQPAFSIKDCGRAALVSNPSTLTLQAEGKTVCRMSLVNTDIVMGIEKNLKKKVQKPKELHRQICEAYAKQPMFVTATQDILDESNLQALYNGGNHGDLIVYASEQKISMVERVGRHLFLGVAQLQKLKEKVGYFTEVTMYETNGNLLDRTRVDIRKISY